ncbi:MAG: Phosphoglycerol transferase [uncultured Rubrobacteraceae bacterium]|uniref:Phosphoglycerol transferase n=1 Tax=uncultured Rubrobacteraceae bacterium TaxID=349277 RepID=A0A6J4QVH8_9ACTN|nr:MAG: Phosphoglycerol transferase [uncultured Rubrobacteraceae bacterium]
MASENDKSGIPNLSGGLLRWRDWVYLLSLLVPLFVYNLALKASSVASIPGLAPGFDLMRSNVFFNLGYALFWIGLFVVVRGGGLARRILVILLHTATIVVVIVTTSAYQYFQQTGTTLDFGVVALWLPQFGEVAPVLASGSTRWGWALLFVALLYSVLGPLLVTRLVGRWRGWPEMAREERSGASLGNWLPSLGLMSLAIGFGLLSLLIGARSTDNPAGASVSFVRDPFVNLVLTGAKGASSEENASDSSVTSQDVEHPAANASLAATSQTGERNVVLIHLESTRASATTPYNEDLETTPFLDELAESSLLVERAYTVVPHTSKASVSVNCGIEPRLVQPTTEAKPGGIPVPCLADLLKEEGYHTGFFQSSTKDFEDFEGLVGNFGYKDYYPLESLSVEGFEETNYFGYEDDILLKPSEEWLKENGDGPFLAEYLLGTGHDDYRCLATRYGSEDFSEDAMLNSYLNCIRYQDLFLKNLFDQYKELGLYENTIFVIYGDHGEAFGEHRRFQHDDVMWEEGLKVPLLIHAPGWFDDGKRVQGLSNQTDILPTVLEMLGYEVENGEYPGYSLLHEPPEDRTLMFSCFHDKACSASLKGTEKYIYHYGNQPDEFFDLSDDPLEKNNLADERSGEVEERRQELIEWRSSINAAY